MNRSILIVSLLATSILPACVGPDAELAESATAAQRGRLPNLPDLGDLDAGACGTEIGSCQIVSESGKNTRVESKRIYDAYFGSRRPRDFGWRIDRELPGVVEALRLPVLPRGHAVASYRAWMSFAPVTSRFSRDDRRPNATIFSELAARRAAPSEWYESLNPYDALSCAVTQYGAPTAFGDIMASNFVWRMLTSPYRMDQALADCNVDPDIPCVDAVATLSEEDIGRVLEIELVRSTPAGGLERSRRLRVVSVDSGHAIASQATMGPNERGPYLRTAGGAGPAMLWRLEMGGSLAAIVGAGPGAMGALVRWSPSNGAARGATPPAGACTDLNEERWKCATDDAGTMKTWVCRDQAWRAAAFGCSIPQGAERDL